MRGDRHTLRDSSTGVGNIVRGKRSTIKGGRSTTHILWSSRGVIPE